MPCSPCYRLEPHHPLMSIIWVHGVQFNIYIYIERERERDIYIYREREIERDITSGIPIFTAPLVNFRKFRVHHRVMLDSV